MLAFQPCKSPPIRQKTPAPGSGWLMRRRAMMGSGFKPPRRRCWLPNGYQVGPPPHDVADFRRATTRSRHRFRLLGARTKSHVDCMTHGSRLVMCRSPRTTVVFQLLTPFQASSHRGLKRLAGGSWPGVCRDITSPGSFYGSLDQEAVYRYSDDDAQIAGNGTARRRDLLRRSPVRMTRHRQRRGISQRPRAPVNLSSKGILVQQDAA